jgi:hypothetical protein
MTPARRSISPFIAALVLGGAALTGGRADAVPLSLSEGARTVFATENPVDQVACWRWGWRGWGWYPFCGPPPPPAVYGYYAPRCRDITERERRGGEVVVRHIHRCD